MLLFCSGISQAVGEILRRLKMRLFCFIDFAEFYSKNQLHMISGTGYRKSLNLFVTLNNMKSVLS